MPLKKCSSGGKSGYKWGDSGKCYTGPGARQKALKQGQAIEANKSRGSGDKRMQELLESIDSVLGGKVENNS